MEEKIIAYLALELFKSEDSRIIVAKGDMISISDWESLSPMYDQGKFEPLTLGPIVEEASRTAESLTAHLDGVLKFNDSLSWQGVEANHKELKRLMGLVTMGRNIILSEQQKAVK